MPSYATLAREYWQTHRTPQYEELTDPDVFFTELGREVERQVVDLWQQLQANNTAPAGEDYLARVGRLNTLKKSAEEIVLHDLVYLDPTPDDETTPPADEPSAGGPNGSDPAPAAPLTDAQQAWIETTADALVDERIKPSDLSEDERHLLLTNLPQRALELTGLTNEENAGE